MSSNEIKTQNWHSGATGGQLGKHSPDYIMGAHMSGRNPATGEAYSYYHGNDVETQSPTSGTFGITSWRTILFWTLVVLLFNPLSLLVYFAYVSF